MFYSLVFVFLCLFSIIEIFNKSRYNNKLFIIASLILLIISGFRYETGGDWQSYTLVFEQIESIWDILKGNNNGFYTHNIEIGFKLLVSFAKGIINNVQFLFFIVSCILVFFLYKSIRTYSKYAILSLIIYYSTLYFQLDFIAIRQGIAVMIFFYSIKFIYEKNKIKYFTFIFIAGLFHTTAFLLLPLYYFLGRSYSTAKICVVFFVSNLLYLLNIRWLTGTLTLLIPQLSGIISFKMEQYSLDSARSISFGFFINIILFILFMIRKKYLLKNKYFNIFFNIFLLYIVVYLVFFELLVISNRFRLYFSISQVILLPMVVYSFKKISNKIYIYIYVIMFSFMSSRFIYLEQIGGIAYNPYQNYVIYKIFGLESTGVKRLEISDENYENNKN